MLKNRFFWKKNIQNFRKLKKKKHALKNNKQISNRKELLLIIFKRVLFFLPKHVKSLEANLQTCQTSMMELFYKNSYFRKKTRS